MNALIGTYDSTYRQSFRLLAIHHHPNGKATQCRYGWRIPQGLLKYARKQYNPSPGNYYSQGVSKGKPQRIREDIMFTGGAGTTPPDSKASAALSATTSSATQPETTFRHSTVKRRSIPVRQGHNNSNSESESSCSRIRSRSPQRIRSRKAGSRHTTRTSHSRSATTGTQRKAESSSGRRTIPEKFREVHLKCRDYMAKGQYEKASKFSSKNVTSCNH